MASSREKEASPEAPSARNLIAGWCERPAAPASKLLSVRAERQSAARDSDPQWGNHRRPR